MLVSEFSFWTVFFFLCCVQMAFKIRSSKFRHVYGSPLRKEQSYENLRLTRNAHDSNFCAVNPQSLAVVTETGGGGSFVVVPVERVCFERIFFISLLLLA